MWNSFSTAAWFQSFFAGLSNYVYEIEDYSVPIYYLLPQSGSFIPSEPINFMYVSDQMPNQNYPEVPEFEADTTAIKIGECVHYTLLSGFGYEMIQWDFEGGIPSYFYGEYPPPIYYNSIGSFDVTVQTSGLGGGCTNVMEGYITVIDPVGCDQVIVNDKFTVLPNPANDYLFIGLLANDKGEIIIYNYLGREIYNTPVNNQSELKINISNYSSGIYFVQYKTTPGITYTEKLIVK